jgi:hypothetical protein
MEPPNAVATFLAMARLRMSLAVITPSTMHSDTSWSWAEQGAGILREARAAETGTGVQEF